MPFITSMPGYAHTGKLADGETDSNLPTPEQARAVHIILKEGTHDPRELKKPIAKIIMACYTQLLPNNKGQTNRKNDRGMFATQQKGTNRVSILTTIEGVTPNECITSKISLRLTYPAA